MFKAMQVLCCFLCCLVTQANASTSSAWQLPTNFQTWRDPFQLVINKPAYATAPELRVLTVHYGNARQIVNLLNQKKSTLLSTQGEIHAYDTNNQILIYDFKPNIQLLRKLLQQLDQPQTPILIKARVINIDQQYAHSLGVLLRSQHDNDTKNNHGIFTLPIVHIYQQNLIEAQLDALIRQGHAKLISAPQLITLANKAALIESGDEIPYQEKSGTGNTSVAFKKAVLSLKVTPQLLPQQQILLQLQVNQDTVSSLNINGVPAIRTQQLKTEMLLHSNETAVLGGITQHTLSTQQQGIPGLQDIPLFGILFRHQHNINSQKELWVFVTPKIIH